MHRRTVPELDTCLGGGSSHICHGMDKVSVWIEDADEVAVVMVVRSAYPFSLAF